MVSEESNALVSSLNAQRGHVLGILDGLPGEALRHAVLPSGWTCLGLVRHLAVPEGMNVGHYAAAGRGRRRGACAPGPAPCPAAGWV